MNSIFEQTLSGPLAPPIIPLLSHVREFERTRIQEALPAEDNEPYSCTYIGPAVSQRSLQERFGNGKCECCDLSPRMSRCNSDGEVGEEIEIKSSIYTSICGSK